MSRSEFWVQMLRSSISLSSRQGVYQSINNTFVLVLRHLTCFLHCYIFLQEELPVRPDHPGDSSYTHHNAFSLSRNQFPQNDPRTSPSELPERVFFNLTALFCRWPARSQWWSASVSFSARSCRWHASGIQSGYTSIWSNVACCSLMSASIVTGSWSREWAINSWIWIRKRELLDRQSMCEAGKGMGKRSGGMLDDLRCDDDTLHLLHSRYTDVAELGFSTVDSGSSYIPRSVWI